MSTYFVSDMHFGHDKIIEYAKRPYKDLIDMHQKMIRCWNHYVREQDTVFVLGDIGWGDVSSVIKQLNGIKILFRGNHDKLSDTKYRSMGFIAIMKSATYNLSQKIVVDLNHLVPAGADPKDIGIFQNRPSYPIDRWLIHGHVHEKWKVLPDKKMINVSWDAWYKPIKREELINIIHENTINKYEEIKSET